MHATAVSASSIDVTWVHTGDTESAFKIERRQQNPDLSWGTWTAAGTAAANATSFNDTGLISQATYLYQVAATNAAGDSAWVESSPVTTPLGITATVGGYKSKGWQYVDVGWTAHQRKYRHLAGRRDGNSRGRAGRAGGRWRQWNAHGWADRKGQRQLQLPGVCSRQSG